MKFLRIYERWYVSIFLLAVIAAFSNSARADDKIQEVSSSGRVIFIEENDTFVSNDDRNYTQGLRLSYLSGPVTQGGWWDKSYTWLGDKLPIFDGADRKRKYEWTILGQSVFTPTNTSSVNASLKDRPYVAWLYTGASLLQETKQESHHTLENAELLIGVVGSSALGGVTQNNFHQFIGVESALGWKNEIKNEPGFVLSYDRKWRFQQSLVGNLAIDVIPELGVSGGNVLTYGQAGIMVRFGQNLAADYGPDRIRPSLSGTGWFDADQLIGDLGWYLFAGTQGRVVGHSIFLDGNTYEKSRSVNKKPLVADFMGGASLFWSSAVRIDFTYTRRTAEFYSQKESPDQFGGINLAFQF